MKSVQGVFRFDELQLSHFVDFVVSSGLLTLLSCSVGVVFPVLPPSMILIPTPLSPPSVGEPPTVEVVPDPIPVVVPLFQVVSCSPMGPSVDCVGCLTPVS